MRSRTGIAAVRFATATAASLVFPFAPHLGAEIWERLNGGRVWEQPWPEAEPELLTSETVTLVSKSTASCATESRCRGGAKGGTAGVGAGQ